MTLTTLRLSSSGLEVAYRDHGSGEPILLIHGVGMQSAAWTPQIAALSAHHRVIAVDMPGHGGSARLPRGSRLPEFVAWAAEVIVALDLGPVNIAGHSMGALIAGGVAVEHPALTRRVALLNGVFERDAAARAAVRTRAAEIETGGALDVDTPLARWFGADDGAAREHVAGWLRAVDIAGYATAYTAFAAGDATYAARFSEIACPFLALTGDGDPNSTPAMSEEMARRVQQGVAVSVPGHRHMVNMTAPDIVNAHLTTWLSEPVDRQEHA